MSFSDVCIHRSGTNKDKKSKLFILNTIVHKQPTLRITNFSSNEFFLSICYKSNNIQLDYDNSESPLTQAFQLIFICPKVSADCLIHMRKFLTLFKCSCTICLDWAIVLEWAVIVQRAASPGIGWWVNRLHRVIRERWNSYSGGWDIYLVISHVITVVLPPQTIQ